MDASTQVAPERRVTIHDVAAATGVAASTVSRALSRPGRVNRITRERIEAAAQALNYVPPAQARVLTSVQTKRIAVLVSDVTNPYFFDFVKATQHHLKTAGITQVLLDTEDSPQAEMDLVEQMKPSIDGAILAASRLPDRIVARLAGEIPVIMLNRSVRGVPSVVIDTPAAVARAVDHLVALGHRHIVYVCGPQNSWANEARWRATETALSLHHLPAKRIGPFPAARSAGRAAADALLHSGATAGIVFNDLIAIGVLARLRECGVGVPEQVSIVGCDNSFGADFCQPALTTLGAPMEHAGQIAVAMMLARLRPSPPIRSSVVLPARLRVRQSTGQVPERMGRVPNGTRPMAIGG